MEDLIDTYAQKALEFRSLKKELKDLQKQIKKEMGNSKMKIGKNFVIRRTEYTSKSFDKDAFIAKYDSETYQKFLKTNKSVRLIPNKILED